MGKVSHGFSIKFVILNLEFYFMVKILWSFLYIQYSFFLFILAAQ